MKNKYKLITGDCLEQLKRLPDNSIDSIITDPPAGISFMGKDWDTFKTGRMDKYKKPVGDSVGTKEVSIPGTGFTKLPTLDSKANKKCLKCGHYAFSGTPCTCDEPDWEIDNSSRTMFINYMKEIFTEVKRVLKPGAHGLVWSLPRTSHWTGMALEDAGFDVRDVIQHLFGTGFPKSHNISKAIQKKQGVPLEVIGDNPNHRPKSKKDNSVGDYNPNSEGNKTIKGVTTDEAKEWSGWGTGLKPSSEFYWLIRKPLSEKSIVDNVIKHGVGGINIDKSRIPTGEVDDRTWHKNPVENKWKDYKCSNDFLGVYNKESNDIGRFPAHTLHDGSEEVMEEFAKAGIRKNGNGNGKTLTKRNKNTEGSVNINCGESTTAVNYGDEGSVARFFYCSKPSPSEKHMGCDELEDKEIKGRDEGQDGRSVAHKKRPGNKKNHHPTVKSVKLMSYLINMITPPGGIILDPFNGSGTTGIAALLNDFRYIGIDMEEEYIKISEARIKNYEKYRKFL